MLLWIRATGEDVNGVPGSQDYRDSAMDDDWIYFAASYGTDNQGRHHCLSFTRSPNKTNHVYTPNGIMYSKTDWISGASYAATEGINISVTTHWGLLTDERIYAKDNGVGRVISAYNYDSSLRSEYGQDDIAFGARAGYNYKNIYGNGGSSKSMSWCCTNGTLLSVVRDGSIVKALTTKFTFTEPPQTHPDYRRYSQQV